MENFIYAQINSNNVCYAVTQTKGEITQSDMIRIDTLDESKLGKTWTGSEWVETEDS